MRKINTYGDFINEKFFKIFNKNKPTFKKSKVDSCVSNILSFLKENEIHDWNDFLNMSTFDRGIVDKIIDNEVKDINELKEVKFLIRLELSDRQQLKEYLKELEGLEEFEKCARIVKKISNKK